MSILASLQHLIQQVMNYRGCYRAGAKFWGTKLSLGGATASSLTMEGPLWLIKLTKELLTGQEPENLPQPRV